MMVLSVRCDCGHEQPGARMVECEHCGARWQIIPVRRPSGKIDPGLVAAGRRLMASLNELEAR